MTVQDQIDKYKNAIINIAVIVFTLVIANNIYKGKTAEIDSLKVKISEEAKKNIEMDKIIRMEKRKDAYKKLFANRETSAIMADISSIASGAGVKVLSVKPSQKESAADYSKEIFELVVTAHSYDILAEFINRIESFKNVYIIDGMEISSSDGFDRKGLTASLRISSVVAN